MGWSERDLEKIDELLSTLPPIIWQGLKAFSRQQRKPDTKKEGKVKEGHEAGSYSEPEDVITLIYVDNQTIVHELGHRFHYENPDIFDDFKLISGWLDEVDISSDALDRFDDGIVDQIKKKATGEDLKIEGGDGVIYKITKKSDNLISIKPVTGGFVSSYAKEDAKEDFAESFEKAISSPFDLRGYAPNKFHFFKDKVPSCVGIMAR